MYKYALAIATLLLGAVLIGGLTQAQEDVQEIALIHSLAVGDNAPTTFPSTITVRLNQPVRLYNIAADSAHAPVAISRDQDGTQPVFGVAGFAVLTGQITVVEFTPTEAGEFFITHRPHGHPIVGRLIVVE